MPKRANRARFPFGFSLLDIVVTVLIVGILTAATAPKFAASLHRYRAQAAAERVQADLMLARESAISSSSTTIVRVAAGSATYQIFNARDLNSARSTYLVNLNEPPYEAAITSADFGGDAEVQFDRYGQPDSGGSMAVQSGSTKVSVVVDWQTGRASIP